MKKYLLVYRGAVSPEDGKQHMNDWMAWVQGMGDAMVDPGTPVGASQTVSANGVTETLSDDPVSGISIIQAVNLDTALDMIKSCPHITIGGSIEVAETMTMPMA